MTERIIKPVGDDGKIYSRFNALVALLNNGATQNNSLSIFQVEDVYLDYGQDWMWTTIVRDDALANGWGPVQILSPRQWKMIVDGDGSVNSIVDCYNDIIHDKYFHF